MIVRILGEGQLEVPESAVDGAEPARRGAGGSGRAERRGGFRPALAALLAKVREVGSPAEAGDLRPSELIIPQQDATMDEVRKLLTDEGLIPG